MPGKSIMLLLLVGTILADLADIGPNQTLSEKYVLQVAVVGGDLVVKLFVKGRHWVGLDLGTNMKDKEAVVVQIVENQVLLNTYHLKGEKRPSLAPTNFYKLQGFALGAKQYVVKFSRRVDLPMVNSAKLVTQWTKWALAWSENPSMVMHDEVLQFQLNPKLKSVKQRSTLIPVLHGAGMTLTWTAGLFGISQIVNHRRKYQSYFSHRLIMICAGSVFLLLIVAANVLEIKATHKSPFWEAHKTIGQVLLYLTAAIMAGGYFVFRRYSTAEKQLPYFAIIKKVHRTCGWTTAILALCNITGGWMLQQHYIFLALSAALCCAGYFLPLKQGPALSNFEQPILQSEQMFIFEDNFYEVKEVAKIHPGGLGIISAVAGLQIDRFVYGNYSMHGVQDGETHLHSQDFILLNGIGLRGSLPQAQPITNHVFRAAGKVRLGQGAHILTFINEEKRQNRVDLQSLGKYFCVDHEGVKRLYSQINCLSKVNVGKMPGMEALARLDYTMAFAVKVYPEGVLSRRLQALTQEGRVWIHGPRGQGLRLGSLGPGRYAVVAAGTGLFPFVDLFYLRLTQPALLRGFQFQFLLIFRPDSVLFPELIQAVQEKCSDWKVRVQRGRNERTLSMFVDQCLLQRDLKQLYFCGPPSLNAFACRIQVLKDKIRIL